MSKYSSPSYKKPSRLSLTLYNSTKTFSEQSTISTSPSLISTDDIIFPSPTILISITCVVINNIKSISLSISKNSSLYIVIEKAINEFNKTFLKENLKIQLKEDSDLFVLKPGRKNGFPKEDMPCFCNESVIGDIYNERIVLCWKEDNQDYVSMFEQERKRECDVGCCLF